MYLFNPVLDILNDFGRIGAFEHQGDAAHCLSFTVACHGTEPCGPSHFNLCHILYQDRHAFNAFYEDVPDILFIPDKPFGPYIISIRAFFYVTPTAVLVICLQCIEYLYDGKVHAHQCPGIHRNLVLLHVPAETAYFYNTGNARKLSFYDPVLDGPQFKRRIFTFITRIRLYHILVDLTQTGCYRHHFRVSQSFRNFSLSYRDLLAHQLTGKVGV